MGDRLKNAIEPLVNRTRDKNGHSFNWKTVSRDNVSEQIISPPAPSVIDDEQPQQAIFDDTSALIPTSPSPPSRSRGIEHWFPVPDTSRFHNYLSSRFLHKFPFLIEIWYWVMTYWPYQLARARTALFISADPIREAAVKETAKNNAVRILYIEQKLGLAIEESLQHFVLKCRPWFMGLLCRIYLAHIAVGIAFLGYGYTYFAREKYQRVRRNIVINNWLAFVVLSFYRCTPPRLMPSSYGFVDPINPDKGPGNDWNNNRFKLTLAAMPSLHFGTALLIGVSIAIWGKHMPLRILAPMYPAVMGFVVVATANHWILDCIGGILVLCTGWRINWVLLGLRPFEDCLFWLLRTEKPKNHVMVSKEEDEN